MLVDLAQLVQLPETVALSTFVRFGCVDCIYNLLSNTLDSAVLLLCDVNRLGQTLEDRLNDMVRLIAVKKLYVKIALSRVTEALHELTNQRDVKVADLDLACPDAIDQEWPAAEIQRHTGKSLVHREDPKAVAADAFLVSERLLECLTQHDAQVLDQMMIVDVNIAARL